MGTIISTQKNTIVPTVFQSGSGVYYGPGTTTFKRKEEIEKMGTTTTSTTIDNLEKHRSRNNNNILTNKAKRLYRKMIKRKKHQRNNKETNKIINESKTNANSSNDVADAAIMSQSFLMLYDENINLRKTMKTLELEIDSTLNEAQKLENQIANKQEQQQELTTTTMTMTTTMTTTVVANNDNTNNENIFTNDNHNNNDNDNNDVDKENKCFTKQQQRIHGIYFHDEKRGGVLSSSSSLSSYPLPPVIVPTSRRLPLGEVENSNILTMSNEKSTMKKSGNVRKRVTWNLDLNTERIIY